MKLHFDSESGVFTIKPESKAEITKLRTSALGIANLLVDYFDADIIMHLSNQRNDDIKATVHGDTELVIEVNGK